MKNLLKSFMLIGLFVFASSNTPPTDAMLLENEVDLMENCLTFDVENDLLGFESKVNLEIESSDPFCIYYYLLSMMYCDKCIEDFGFSLDCVQCNYYIGKLIEKGCVNFEPE